MGGNAGQDDDAGAIRRTSQGGRVLHCTSNAVAGVLSPRSRLPVRAEIEMISLLQSYWMPPATGRSGRLWSQRTPLPFSGRIGFIRRCAHPRAPVSSGHLAERSGHTESSVSTHPSRSGSTLSPRWPARSASTDTRRRFPFVPGAAARRMTASCACCPSSIHARRLRATRRHMRSHGSRRRRAHVPSHPSNRS